MTVIAGLEYVRRKSLKCYRCRVVFNWEVSLIGYRPWARDRNRTSFWQKWKNLWNFLCYRPLWMKIFLTFCILSSIKKTWLTATKMPPLRPLFQSGKPSDKFWSYVYLMTFCIDTMGSIKCTWSQSHHEWRSILVTSSQSITKDLGFSRTAFTKYVKEEEFWFILHSGYALHSLQYLFIHYLLYLLVKPLPKNYCYAMLLYIIT